MLQITLGCFYAQEDAIVARDRAILHFGLDLPLEMPARSKLLGAASVEELRALGALETRAATSSKYRGVRAFKKSAKWAAAIHLPGGVAHIGVFENAEDAALAYDRVALAHGRSGAQLNFPDRSVAPASIEAMRAWAKQRAAEQAEERGALKPGTRGARNKRASSWGVNLRNDGRFGAYVRTDNKIHTLGSWPTEREAAILRDRVVLYLGLDQPLNHPESSRALGPLSVDAARASATRKQSRSPRRKEPPEASRSYRGVRWSNGAWTASVANTYIGRFTRAEDAAIAHDRVALTLGNPRVSLNFPRRKLAPGSIPELRRWAREVSERTASSRFHGVYFWPIGAFKEWGAMAPGHVHVGLWKSEREAALAYDRACLHLDFPEKLNFPEEAQRLGPATPKELRAEAHRQYKETTTSSFNGVHWSRREETWGAGIRHRGITYKLGTFAHEDMAAEEYDRMARRLHKKKAKLNFP